MQKNDRNGLEAFLTGTEAVADVIMNGELITSIPFVGLAWKSAKAMDDIRDRLFMAKVGRFMSGIGQVSEAEQQQIKETLAKQSGVQKVGEVVLLTLEQLNDLNKATLIGSLFRIYIDGQLSGDDLRRLAGAINIAFWDDLTDFVWGQCDNACQRRLMTAGFYHFTSGFAFESHVSLNLNISPLGRTLLEFQSMLPIEKHDRQ